MTTVTPKVGYYLVRLVGPEGINTHLVGKDKHCSCGGNAKRQCSHIRAVTRYLQSGGERAPAAGTAGFVHDSKPVAKLGGIPDACPICGSGITRLGFDFWRCVTDAAHYWMWRGEKVRMFLTLAHPAKLGAFYQMTEQERKVFLTLARHRMHVGGYTPHSLGGNGHE
jgi:hypothetical protein